MTQPPKLPQPAPEQGDPTGVRSLLSSLPDPTPMPPTVVERIEASLAAAAAAQRSEARAGSVGASSSPWMTEPPGARRAPSRAIAALAAGFLAIAGTGMFALRSLRSEGPATAPPMVITPRSTASTQPEEPPARSASPGGSTWPTVAPSPNAASGAVVLFATDTRYTQAALAVQAAVLWAAPGPSLPPLAAEQPGIGPLGTPAGLAGCLDALGLDAPERTMIDFALYEQRPAAVLITRTGPRTEVRVVERSCRDGNPGLIREAITVTARHS